MRLVRLMVAVGIMGIVGLSTLPVWAAGKVTGTNRGAVVETDRYRVEFRDGVLVSLFNKLTNEEYLDRNGDLNAVVPHLPSGLGTQAGEPARAAAEKLYHWPWWEHPKDLYLPNQHYPDANSGFEFKADGEQKAVIGYKDLTDGKQRFPDENFSITLQLDAANGDLLVTPAGQSPRPGVYAANMTMAPLAPAVAIQAPIVDGIRITRQNTGPVLWVNKWPDYWNFGFIALDGWKRGAFGIWAEDQKIRLYKNFFYLNNSEGLSISLSMMNIPPFEELKECRSPLPWRIQAFDKSWAQAAARYRAWRAANVRLAPRSEFAQKMSFIASVAGPQKLWLDTFIRYVQPYQGHAGAFLTCVRKQPFDHNHADNTPVDSFTEDAKRWRESGAYGMAYLQPMIMWGPFRPENERSEREKQALSLHKEANTHSVFQKDPKTVVPNVDTHHLGHPGWQRWMLDWVKEYCQQYGAQGIYHDSAYEFPIDRRGLAVNGMTTPEGVADYFYRAATENPGTFHSTEQATEATTVAIDNGIANGYDWGTAPYMRLTRGLDSSPITAALMSPYTVEWSFQRLRGDSVWDLRDRRMQEAHAHIAGAIDGPFDYQHDARWYPFLANTAWHDRTRDVAFLQHGLRPYFPEDYDRQVLSYYHGDDNTEFRFERTPWGTQFVQIGKDGARTFVFGIASDVQAAPVTNAGIVGWVVYNNDDPNHTWNRTGPAGLHPERYYVLDPSVKRPPVYFSSTQGYGPSFYESYVEDSGFNDYFAFLKLRTIGKLRKVTGSEQVTLHSPAPPKAICVNGKKTEFQRQGNTDAYAFGVSIPADICVLLKDPPSEPAKLHEAALLRVTETETPVDYYRPEALQKFADGGTNKQGQAVLQDAAIAFAAQFGVRKYLYVPMAAPAGSKGGVIILRLSSMLGGSTERKGIVERVTANMVTLAKAEGAVLVPETIEIPLDPGEIKLVAFETRKLDADESLRCITRVTPEWQEKDK